MDYVDMGKRVRKQRQLIGLTQQELAERIGRMVIREILTTLQEQLSDWGPD